MDKKFKRKEDGFDFTPKRVKQESGELEVTGVSRSGRVRKKSSKLMDFENLDEIDIRSNAKKKEKADPFLTSVARLPKKEVRQVVKEEVFTDEDLGDTSMPYVKQERLSDESDHEIIYPPQHEESSMESIASDLEDGDENDLSRIQSEGFQSIAGDPDFHSSPRSVFPVEKVPNSKKKLVIKDGKIVGRVKTPKKEKTPGRLSAYMLWAKEIRQELVRSNPNLDFSQTSKKLGELWSTVPMHEKHIWKKRAKRAAEGTAAVNTPVKSSPNVKGFGQQQQQQIVRPLHDGKKMKSPQPRKLANKSSPNDLGSSPLGNSMLSSNSSPEMKVISKSHSDQSVYKPVGTTPLDVAAHIRLLGESLTIIGERLTEHEGQIAVSGSFSVLLDSLLCVLAPLMCLTQQVPQMNVIPQEQLSGLMDNIAYIMPGL